MGSGDDLAPVWSQATAWDKDDLLSIGPGKTNSINLNQLNFFQKYVFEYVCNTTFCSGYKMLLTWYRSPKSMMIVGTS